MHIRKDFDDPFHDGRRNMRSMWVEIQNAAAEHGCTITRVEAMGKAVVIEPASPARRSARRSTHVRYNVTMRLDATPSKEFTAIVISPVGKAQIDGFRRVVASFARRADVMIAKAKHPWRK